MSLITVEISQISPGVGGLTWICKPRLRTGGEENFYHLKLPVQRLSKAVCADNHRIDLSTSNLSEKQQTVDF